MTRARRQRRHKHASLDGLQAERGPAAAKRGVSNAGTRYGAPRYGAPLPRSVTARRNTRALLRAQRAPFCVSLSPHGTALRHLTPKPAAARFQTGGCVQTIQGSMCWRCASHIYNVSQIARLRPPLFPHPSTRPPPRLVTLDT